MASEQLRKDLLAEYFKVYEAVHEFDKRLITVKGWGVTLSLAAVAWAFEKQHSGLFLVAALSGLGFWAIEGIYKRYQMRSYVRMREIEVVCYRTWLFAGVMFPHVISVVAGLGLFCLALLGVVPVLNM